MSQEHPIFSPQLSFSSLSLGQEALGKTWTFLGIQLRQNGADLGLGHTSELLVGEPLASGWLLVGAAPQVLPLDCWPTDSVAIQSPHNLPC